MCHIVNDSVEMLLIQHFGIVFFISSKKKIYYKSLIIHRITRIKNKEITYDLNLNWTLIIGYIKCSKAKFNGQIFVTHRIHIILICFFFFISFPMNKINESKIIEMKEKKHAMMFLNFIGVYLLLYSLKFWINLRILIYMRIILLVFFFVCFHPHVNVCVFDLMNCLNMYVCLFVFRCALHDCVRVLLLCSYDLNFNWNRINNMEHT